MDEGRHAFESILWEANPNYCREEVTVVSGQNLGANKVIGKITTGGKFAVYANGAGDGTEAAAGVLLSAVDATSADKKGVALVRGPAIVKKDALDWGTSDATMIAAAIVDLATHGILVQ